MVKWAGGQVGSGEMRRGEMWDVWGRVVACCGCGMGVVVLYVGWIWYRYRRVAPAPAPARLLSSTIAPRTLLFAAFFFALLTTVLKLANTSSSNSASV